MRRTHSNRINTALVTVLSILCIAFPTAAAEETITLSGIITEVVQAPPDPFSVVKLGDTWTLSYTFDTSVADVDGSALAGQYPQAVTDMTLTIGSATVTGVPGVADPNGLGSGIFVNLTDDYADYSALMGLPADSSGSPGWAQVALWRDIGTPFGNDSLPIFLPEPLSEKFPDRRDFFLRQLSSTLYFLKGKINCPPVFETIGAWIVYEKNELAFQVFAHDLDGDFLTYAVENPGDLPNGASFDPETQWFNWEPHNNQAGRYLVTFTVDDGINPIVKERVEITVLDNPLEQIIPIFRKKVNKKKITKIETTPDEVMSIVTMSKEELETSYDLDITLINSVPEDPNVTTTVFEGCSGNELFRVNGECFDIITDAISFDSVDICVTFDESAVKIASLDLKHYDVDVGTWESITTSVTTTGNKVTICGNTLNLSPFFVVTNNLPVVGQIIGAPSMPQPVDTAKVTISANFTDVDEDDTHTAVCDWGDLTTSPGDVVETLGSGSAACSHTYTTPGVYTIDLTVTDDYGGSGTSQFRYVVVYDPLAGFVTGGGWIESPEGAYAVNPSLTGKANFGFVSKYNKGANELTGQTQFQFKVADLNFHSDTYQWLVIAGARAQYKGTGTINGEGNFGFMLTAIDGALPGGGGSDKFRMKIWDMDADNVVVYDNQMDAEDGANLTTTIGGGSIVIHSK